MIRVRPSTSFVPLSPGAMSKSILDAHGDLVDLLARTKVHFYEDQDPGEDSKRVLDVVFMSRHGNTDTKLSLYKPETKRGTMPRFWVYGLSKIMSAGEVLGVHVYDGKVWLFNASDRDMVLRSYEARR